MITGYVNPKIILNFRHQNSDIILQNLIFIKFYSAFIGKIESTSLEYMYRGGFEMHPDWFSYVDVHV